MLSTIAFTLAGLVALAILGIGCVYLASPERIWGGFGLRPPAPDADTRAWLRLKGTRDIASGLVVLLLLVAANRRSVGLALLALATIPFGDMSVVLASRGSKSKAFFIHGITCAVMLAAAFLLLHAEER